MQAMVNLKDMGRLLHLLFHVMLKPWMRVPFDHHIFSTANSCPLDQRTTASGTLMHCSFESVTVNERVSPGRMGRSRESLHPFNERFHTVPCPWNGPALYVTEHCRGNAGRDES
jgi:hypothetical protein